MKEDPETPNTWCPIGGFRALKIFLASAAQQKKRIWQLDYVAAFLQSDVIGRKFTILPVEWKELFKDHPEVLEWLGVPLLLLRSLYGDVVANLAWDTTQSEWLTSPEIGFERLPSEPSLYRKETEKGMMLLINSVDDQMYYATVDELRIWFEKKTKERFDVQLLGQANWYLQSRVTQLADYSIVLDQSRYAALICDRYLKPLSSEAITKEMKSKYASPLPSTVTFTKDDSSNNYLEVKALEEEFGFQYAAAVGSLIYLMNTFVRLNFGIRKLARFMQLPGKQHFKYLHHMLRHIQCHRCSAGIKFYSNPAESPIHQLMSEKKLSYVNEYPIVIYADTSFQDCLDTSRSTGAHLIFMQGGVIDQNSSMPSLISMSSCEAEYSNGSLAVMAAAYCRKIYNEIYGRPADTPLSIPLGLDSQSAIDTARSFKDTQRTRHIARRFHYVRYGIQRNAILIFKIEGTCNPSNSLTKPLSVDKLNEEANCYQVNVSP
jgi:hypothetical protein